MNATYGCSICGALSLDEPPHSWGEPCPQKVAVDEAYIAMLDAQRMSHIRAGSTTPEMLEYMRRMTDEIAPKDED